MVLGLDFETYSDVDIAKVGSYRYIEDASFEPLLVAYAYDDDVPTVIDLTKEEMPRHLLDAMTDPSILKTAWNVAFERKVLHRAWGVFSPPEQWQDSMILAGVNGLPMSLGGCGKALNMPQDSAKDAEGKRLIKYFCCPCKPTKVNNGRTRNMPEHAPLKWEKFIDYNRQDVVAERAIRKILEKQYAPDATEHKFWCLDARINWNGVKIDRQLAEQAVALSKRNTTELTEQAVKLTGLSNPNSITQVKEWLEQQEGIEIPTLNKKAVADVVAALETDKTKEFMAVRAELSKTSVKKYEAMLRCRCEDDHARGCFAFYGANRTGRFAGRLIQFQNLPQNHMEDLDACRNLVKAGDYDSVQFLWGGISNPLSELIRTALIPEDGCKWIVADFSAIEARVIAWIAQEQWRLETFRNGGDIYCASASQMFKVPVEKHGQNAHLRQKGKVAELACGYGGGVGALKAFGADKMGLSEEEMARIIADWRAASPRIVGLWKALEVAAIKCIRDKLPTRSSIGDICFNFRDGVMWMQLPSGRKIAYPGATYAEGNGKYSTGRKVISFMGVDQMTKKWGRIETFGGRLTENCWGADTSVLTDSGWKRIADITKRDLIYDGESFVAHGGLACRGKRRVIRLDGLWVTPEHKILTTEGWQYAEKCNGLDRLQVQLPDGYRTNKHNVPQWKTKVASAVRMWRRKAEGYRRYTQEREEGQRNFMRLPNQTANLRGKPNAWHDESPSLRGVAQHGATLHGANASGLEELRGQGHQGLRAMAAQLRELLGGHGTNVSARIRFRPRGQRERLLARELPLDRPKDELFEQAQHCVHRYPDRQDACKGGGGNKWHKLHNAFIPQRPRCSGRINVRKTRCGKQVYDILNCGPNHRYVVLGKRSPLIAHNCIQATARDCLRDCMLALESEGYDIRAHVHDEVIISEPRDSGRGVKDVVEIMSRELPWAKGLPLTAAGYEGDYYFKD